MYFKLFYFSVVYICDVKIVGESEWVMMGSEKASLKTGFESWVR